MLTKIHKDRYVIFVKLLHKYLYYSRDLTVILGVTNPSNPKEAYTKEVFYVKMIQHPQYTINSIDYNLMLIKLNTNIKPNKYVNLITLPQKPVSLNATCTASTWAFYTCNIGEYQHDHSFSSLTCPLHIIIEAKGNKINIIQKYYSNNNNII